MLALLLREENLDNVRQTYVDVVQMVHQRISIAAPWLVRLGRLDSLHLEEIFSLKST